MMNSTEQNSALIFLRNVCCCVVAPVKKIFLALTLSFSTPQLKNLHIHNPRKDSFGSK